MTIHSTDVERIIEQEIKNHIITKDNKIIDYKSECITEALESIKLLNLDVRYLSTFPLIIIYLQNNLYL